LPTDESDERLLLRFREGDAGAFEILMRRHRAPCFAFLARLTGDRARAEDLLQETWMRVIGAAPRWEPRARFRTWLYAVARNLAADEARRAVHRRAEPLEAPARPGGRPPAEGLAGDCPAPDRAAESALLRPRILEALASLPEEQREVFLLREHAGVPFAEIAEITGAPVPTVKSRMRYALEGLRRRLAELGVEPGADAPEGTGT
jgi:RNA polymerase sigma-70 factor (ECF subfamily)